MLALSGMRISELCASVDAILSMSVYLALMPLCHLFLHCCAFVFAPLRRLCTVVRGFALLCRVCAVAQECHRCGVCCAVALVFALLRLYVALLRLVSGLCLISHTSESPPILPTLWGSFNLYTSSPLLC